MTDDGGPKYLTTGRLRELLTELPDDMKLSPNRVGNLAVYNPDNTYFGFIDFILDGEIETKD